MRALEEASNKSLRIRRERSGSLATAALVLDAWHRKRPYLDLNAVPRAVRLLGRGPSVEALIKAETGARSAKEFANRLRHLGLVIPHGRGLYVPSSDMALISGIDTMLMVHVERSLGALLETVEHNVTHRNERDRLLERFAEVPDLPVGELPAFRRFARLQGTVFLRTINDWLETRRVGRSAAGSGSSRRVAKAGIHVVAYEKRRAPQKVGPLSRSSLS